MISLFEGKSFNEIEYLDIEKLISRRIPESLILDYKGDIFQSGKPKAKDFGKDISAFSNSYGGWLIYGIATEEGDEILPDKKNPIVGLEDQGGLKEQFENMILSSISPKPLYRIKKIPIPQTSRCLILVYVPRSYEHVHMVALKGEHRFYKRYEYSSVPMDYYEVKNKFDEVGLSEQVRGEKIQLAIQQVAECLPEVTNNEMLGLVASPLFLIKDHFNDKVQIQKLHDSNRQHAIIKYSHNARRKSNRFYTELVFEEQTRKASLNYFYNGIIVQLMPIDLFDKNQVNASALYYYTFHFLELVTKYFNLFNFQTVIELRFLLKGIKGKKLVFIKSDRQRFWNKSFQIDEEIESQTLKIDLHDLESQKTEITSNLIQPLFYGLDFDVPEGLSDENGNPIYYQ
ncbi:MAG: ATP-binding protein [Nitrosopumilus sp.]